MRSELLLYAGKVQFMTHLTTTVNPSSGSSCPTNYSTRGPRQEVILEMDYSVNLRSVGPLTRLLDLLHWDCEQAAGPLTEVGTPALVSTLQIICWRWSCTVHKQDYQQPWQAAHIELYSHDKSLWAPHYNWPPPPTLHVLIKIWD